MPTAILSVAFILDVQSGNFLVAPDAALLVGTFVALALWILVAAAVGRAAGQRGQSRALFFAVSLVFSPIIAIVLLLVLGRRPYVQTR